MSASPPAGGAHCDEAGCHQLDFLPFTCPHCHHIYCLAHRDPTHHHCSVDITQHHLMPTCPVCRQTIFVNSTQSPDAVVNAHILSSCQLHLMKDVEVGVKRKQGQVLRCDLPSGCSNREKYSTVQCKKCHHQFCLTHRFPENHQCTALSSSSSSPSQPPDRHAKGKALIEKLRREREEKEAQKATLPTPRKPAVQRRAQTTTLQQIRAQMSSVGSYIAETLTGSPSPSALSPPPSPSPAGAPAPPAPSVAMRKAATGDERVPSDERWYLYVDTSPVRSRPVKDLPVVWVNRQWTVGRVIDGVCERVGIECQNHLQGGKKIGLGCERTMGQGLLPNDLPLHLLTPAVMNGDTVQLRYRAPSPAPSPVPTAPE